MKKTLALLICLAMLFTALSVNVFAAEEPTVEIVTNSISAGKTTFAVKINGNPVAGVDIKVDVTGDAEITGVSAKNFDVKDTLTDGEDYKISGDKKSLHAVGLQKEPTTGEIISVTANATKNFTIKVSCDIATSSTDKVVVDNLEANVTADAPIIDENVTDNTVSQPEGNDYFIPYGSVYKVTDEGKYEYANKGTEGTFNGTNGMTATQFKVPTNGLGTFGISESMKETTNPSKQFGNYTNTYSPDNKYGTMIIVGDWVGFKDWYLANKGYSDAVLFEKVYTAYKTAMEKPEAVNADYVRLTAGGKEIHVYDVPQTKVMWQSGSVLEYAVRVINNFNEEKSYSAAAYCIKGENDVLLSKDILTTVINSAAANN